MLFSLFLSLSISRGPARISRFCLRRVAGWRGVTRSSQSRRDLCMDWFVRCELSSSGQEFILSRVEKGGWGS